jgi:predicted DNA-binding transcriptional regulator YafY
MAKKRKTSTSPAKPPSVSSTVTLERFTRLYRMVLLLAGAPQTRETVARRLRLDVRGFYRDLELLRGSGVTVVLTEGRYSLDQKIDDALALLPFPDPHLTLGEVRLLAKGRTPAHRKLAQNIKDALPS